MRREPIMSPFKLGSFGNVLTQAGAEAHYILLIAWTHGQGKWESAAAVPGNHFSELTFRRKCYVRPADHVHKSARQSRYPTRAPCTARQYPIASVASRTSPKNQ